MELFSLGFYGGDHTYHNLTFRGVCRRTCYMFWFSRSLFNLVLLGCLYSHDIGFEILCGAMVITMFMVMCCSLFFGGNMEVPLSFSFVGCEELGRAMETCVESWIAEYWFAWFAYLCACSLVLHDVNYTSMCWYWWILDASIIFRFDITYVVGVLGCDCSLYDRFGNWSLWLHVMVCICWWHEVHLLCFVYL